MRPEKRAHLCPVKRFRRRSVMCTRLRPFLCDYQYLRIGHQYLRINSVGCWVVLVRRREVRLEARKRKRKGRGNRVRARDRGLGWRLGRHECWHARRRRRWHRRDGRVCPAARPAACGGMAGAAGGGIGCGSAPGKDGTAGCQSERRRGLVAVRGNSRRKGAQNGIGKRHFGKA